MAKSKFYEQIKSSIIEREVEDVYNQGINLYFQDSIITHPFACDGFIDTKSDNGKILKLIIEYKLDELLKNKVARAKVLIQVVYYLKRFENNGLILPNVCMVGDKNECFVMHTNELLKYLDENVDWTIAPSNAYVNNGELVSKIANDDAINPFIFDINENFSFKEVANKIKDLADNVQRYVRVTEHNIAVIYDYFINNVIKDAKKVTPNDLVSIFMGVITNKNEYYQHPEKKNILVAANKEIAINGDGFKSFFSYFDRNYTPQEKMKFAEISDRLIEDTKRRNTGEFYTPTLFVDYAHRMLEKQFGDDWKEKYVVWDNCCGTKNLTRDYAFADLYCSTLEDAELEIAKNYNKNSMAFKFDFLNDSMDNIPQGLKSALQNNKPIIFLINPPYARAGKGEDGSGRMGTDKGSTLTMVNEQMKQDKIGACSANLYAQFLYRIMKIKQQYGLTNCHIGLFSPTLFLSGGSWKGFRSVFFNNFSFADAVQFQASHFADVADNWGISFSIWNSGVNADNNNFNYNLIDNIYGEIQIVGKKNVYNTDGLKTASDWCNVTIEKQNETPTMKSALNIGSKTLKTNTNVIGWFTNGNNNVNYNTQEVYVMSCPNDRGKTNIPIINENFGKFASLFSARKLVACNWVNSKDEYLAPNEENEKYNEFVNDSIIYSLFHSSSNQSSLRGIEYKGKRWDIKNEFFFMGKEEMMALANENGYDECYNDCKVSNERYVYGLLKDIELSAEAKAVLDKAIEITRKTFAYRGLFNEEHVEYQVMNWDCGWYQIKAIAKEYAKDDYKVFCDLFKKLADKMRPMVYELGFLK